MNALLEAARIIEAEASSIQECETNPRTGAIDANVKGEIQHYRTVAALLRHANETLVGPSACHTLNVVCGNCRCRRATR